MVARLNARQTDRRSQSVGEQPRQSAVIFVGDDSRDGPHRRGGRGRQPRFAPEEVPGSLALGRPLTLEAIFQRLDHDKAVNRRFSSKKSSLTLVLVVRKRAPNGEPASYAGQRECSVGRDAPIVLLRLDVCRQMPAYLPIRYEESGCKP